MICLSSSRQQMNQILETIDKASQTFMLGYVTLDEAKIEEFRLEDMKSTATFFEPPSYLKKVLESSERKTAYKIIHIFCFPLFIPCIFGKVSN